MPRPIILPPLGGYIPFINIPCERDIGESIKWVVVLSLLPLNCQLVPWLCCPLPIEPKDSDFTISTDITCDDPRAPVGAMIHWGMVIVSIVGLILALFQVTECALVLTGVLNREIPTTIILEITEPAGEPDPFTTWFDNLQTSVTAFQQNYLIYPSNYNGNKTLTLTIPRDQLSFSNVLSLLADPSILFPQGKAGDEQRNQIVQLMRNASLPLDHRLKDTEAGQNLSSQEIDALIRKILPEPEYVDDYEYVDEFRAARALGSKPDIDVRNSSALLQRVRRQAVLDVPIPILRSFYAGTDAVRIDGCSRNEVRISEDDDNDDGDKTGNQDDDDDCYEVLSRGPCDKTEIVLVNPTTKKGFCGERLCSPDRVFLFNDQKCHDPHEIGLCPSGRQLFSSGFGTPVCGCEDGFYELEVDDDDEECHPLLTEIPRCPPGKVFWFSSFGRPPHCLPDPCDGLNLNRRHSELPFAPALADGKCYQIGSQPDICRSDQYFSLNLPLLKGVCETLEGAGYVTLNSEYAELFRKTYGPPLSKDSPVTPLPIHHKHHKSTWRTNQAPRPAIGAPVVPPVGGFDRGRRPLSIGQPVVSLWSSGQWPQGWALKPTHVNSHSPPYISVNGNVTINVFSGATVHVDQDQAKVLHFPHSKSGGVATHQRLIKVPDDKTLPSSKLSREEAEVLQVPESSSHGQKADHFSDGQQSRGKSLDASPHSEILHDQLPAFSAVPVFPPALPSSSPPSFSTSSLSPPSFSTSSLPSASFSTSSLSPPSFSTSSLSSASFSSPSSSPSVRRGLLIKRDKRSPLPHASPSNVFESALTVCKAGAARDINQKCRDTILPSREAHSRPRRTTQPVSASPDCPALSLCCHPIPVS
ncbi:uncharacterized protein LOC108677099 [Hyalella azteca]|uniref:Uncharacterized protein LOC108677099 n=1 Tax=Hyalella azteca TaxID=294128 RepID=A0A8B7P3W2_HYAAZ|nr:uncharacterized protein LOC108677099 [Hyalella azteca]